MASGCHRIKLLIVLLRAPWDDYPLLSLSPNTFLPAPLQAFAHIKGHCLPYTTQVTSTHHPTELSKQPSEVGLSILQIYSGSQKYAY